MPMEAADLLVWSLVLVKTSVPEQHIESPGCFHLANVAPCLLASLSGSSRDPRELKRVKDVKMEQLYFTK